MAEWVGRGGIPPYPSPDHLSSFDGRDGIGFGAEDRYGPPRYGGDWRDDRRGDPVTAGQEWDPASGRSTPSFSAPSSLKPPSVFFVRADPRPPSPQPLLIPHPAPKQPQPPAAYTGRMERTSSGISIATDTLPECPCCCGAEDEDDPTLVDDEEAARIVREQTADFLRRHPDSAHERILRSLMHPRAAEADFALDDAALGSIFSATNEIFFRGRLTRRVEWDWSHWSTGHKYAAKIIGTTAMRRSRRLGGYETLIVLSSPILRDARYSRRLLISTFLHELIHSYLFVSCGHRARRCGGHTPGFRQIASLIDDFAGPGTLHLREMEADLERFRLPAKSHVSAPAAPHQQHQRHQHRHYQPQHWHPHDDDCGFDRLCCDDGWVAGGSHDEWECPVTQQQQPAVTRPPVVVTVTQHTFTPQHDLW